MEKKRLFYDKKILDYIAVTRSLAASLEYQYEDTYLNYHNHICPGCEKEMKIVNGTVKNIGSVSSGTVKKTRYLYPYVLCTDCVEIAQNPTKNIGELVERHISKVLPHLGIEFDEE